MPYIFIALIEREAVLANLTNVYMKRVIYKIYCVPCPTFPPLPCEFNLARSHSILVRFPIHTQCTTRVLRKQRDKFADI